MSAAGPWAGDGVEFRRRGDAFTYRFEPAAPREGRPAWKRVDLDLWLAWVSPRGWCVVDAAGVCNSRPWGLEPADQRGDPPEGEWISKKGDKSYVYDLGRLRRPHTSNTSNA